MINILLNLHFYLWQCFWVVVECAVNGYIVLDDILKLKYDWWFDEKIWHSVERFIFDELQLSCTGNNAP